ncbi:exonuclease/endonuclease/phosphatase family protein [Maribacter arenosus]|uniref:Endonuclease/Exonuclease/phosphatase family protein n=1 Tax=Maribacter arenosus TaxID=1854708 RepID=A0ABR7VG41_9FLAO|nr:hypothetical protein [Maribacter arenosus]MBD0851881.1 hypothetical protein [Maribacter arenosus]
MKIATFNIQNLFHRHTEMVELEYEIKSEIWKEEFEILMLKAERTEENYIRMRELANLLGFHSASYEPYLSMLNFDGSLHVKSSMKVMETRASYMTDWNGWTKLKSVPISKNSIINKAKVINEVNPDIILVQQVENRESLIQFHNSFFKENQSSNYEEIMHLQGNDGKGLGMGILLKKGYHLKSLKSFSNERDTDGSLLFNTDFQQYKIKTPESKTLYLLCCQLAGENASDTLRKRQAKKVAEVYTDLLSKGIENIVIAGTLNAPSYADCISPIMESGVSDVVKHQSFDVIVDSGKDAGYYRMGAYRMGVNIKQKDYLLVSPILYDKINTVGMNRKGMWPLNKPEWETYETVEKEKDAASDHPLLWADFKLEDSIRLYKKSA